MNPREYYEENGYIIFRGLVAPGLIDALLALYRRDIVPSNQPFFRQNTNRYERNDLTSHGFVKQAFLDIHDYGPYPEWSEAAKAIFFSRPLQDALGEATGFPAFNLMQSMLFDANTETPPHQDWWYLDSVPNGHLLGAWIALENIDARAGQFYVIPCTTGVDLRGNDANLSHDAWLARVKEFAAQNQDRIAPADMQKGDVLFWNSRTVHGALPTQDPSFSRKSLTAHFLPSHLQFGNLFVLKEFINYKEFNGAKYYKNQPDYSWRSDLKSRIKGSVYNSPKLMKLFRTVQKSVKNKI